MGEKTPVVTNKQKSRKTLRVLVVVASLALALVINACGEGESDPVTPAEARVAQKEAQDDPTITKYGQIVVVELDRGEDLDGEQLDKARQRCGTSGVAQIVPVSTGEQRYSAGTTSYIVFECERRY